jgi:hypothetical protein
VLGSVTRALLCRWRTATKDRVAPTLAGIGPALPSEEAANAAQTDEATDGGGDDRSQRVPPRRGTGQCFGQLVKFRRLHLCELLPERDCKEKAKLVKPFFQRFRMFAFLGEEASDSAAAL